MKRTIRMLSLLLALVLLLPCLPARAADPSGSCGDNLSWSFDEGSGVLTISGSGDMYPFDEYDDFDADGNYIGRQSNVPWHDYVGKIVRVVLPDGLTLISSHAFRGCVNLRSVSIPEGVTAIDWNAFEGCSSLQNVTIPGSVRRIGNFTFSNCAGLQSVTIPEGVAEIGNYAFANCTGLENISLPSSVNRIEYDAFDNTAYYNNLNNWENYLLYLDQWLIAAVIPIDRANIRPGTVGISDSAFEGMYGMTSVTLPEGLEYIGNYAFSGCENLFTINVPNSVKRIGANAFFNTGVFLDPTRWTNGLLYLGNWLVAAEPGIVSANLRAGTIGISDYTFYDALDLDRAALPDGLRYIGDEAFSFCGNLKTLRIPNSVVDIGIGAFHGCSDLSSVTLPTGLSAIREGSFAYCERLTGLTIPNGVKSIEKWAFLGCVSLRQLILPESVSSIGFEAFEWCGGLSHIVIPNRDCAIYDNDLTFGGPYGPAIVGHPGSTADAYARKYWYEFINIEDAPFIDVPASAYFAVPVAWAVEKGVTNGTAPYFFSPDSTCTRAQVVTFLWRAAGSPEPGSNRNPFTDVPADQYYYKAVLWAVEQGITTGTSTARFSPDAGCTRGQVVTFLWRAMGRPEPGSAQNPFTDVNLGEYYGKAVLWAVENGITNGTSATRFSPANTCTRGQIVTFLYRTHVGSGEPAPSRDDLVGISMPTKDLMRWSQDGTSMQRALAAAGYAVDLQFAANNPSMQISQIENMIAYGAKVLIISAIDSDAMDTPIRQAREAGCTVIAYDRPIGSDAVDYYISIDNFAIGAAQGRFIADQLDLAHAGSQVYNIELAAGSPEDPSASVFYDGAMSVLRPYIDAGTLKVVSGQVRFEDVATEGWSSDNARTRFENLLTRYYADKPLDAVMCSNDSTAQGVALAIENVYRNDVYPIITGQDCDIVSVKNMLDDKQAMSVFKDTRMMANKVVETAEAVLKGAAPAASASYTTFDRRFTYPAIYCEPIVCTRDRIRSLLIDSGYYTAQELGL